MNLGLIHIRYSASECITLMHFVHVMARPNAAVSQLAPVTINTFFSLQ